MARPFKLVSERPAAPKHWHRLAPLVAFIRKPVWTREEVDRVFEIVAKRGMDNPDLDYLESVGEPDLIERLSEMLWHYLEIAKSPNPPTTAYLRRQTTIPSRETRAVVLYRRIQADMERQRKRVESRRKHYKTFKADSRSSEAAYAADERWQSLKRYQAMLRRYAPDVSYWVQTRRYA